MNSITCNKCSLKYKDDVVPRILDCSHSICTECTTTCIQSSAGCPVCKRCLTKSSATDYPINDELVQNNIATTEKYLKKLSHSMEDELIEKLSIISIGLQSIKNLVNGDYFDAAKTEETLSDLSKTMGLKTKLQGSVTHQRYGFDSDKDYINDIYERISSNEVFYAVKNIDGETKFARLSVMNLKNQIVLHAFGPPVLGKNLNTVMFSDLKRIFSSSISNPVVFLHANKYKFIIKTLNSNLTSQFTKYCTGEIGPVYKGSSIKSRKFRHENMDQYYMQVDKFMLNGVKSKGNFEFMFDDAPFNKKYGTADIICLAYVDGSFELINLKWISSDILSQSCFTNCSVVGIIEEQNNLFKKSFMSYEGRSVINDSGIILNFDVIHL